jgi:xylulokinase
LTLQHTRADIYRSLLESVGYGIRHNIETLSTDGAFSKRILGVGGGTLNLEWMQIICDIADIGMVISKQQLGSPYGVAFMAGVGTGFVSGWGEIKTWLGDTIKLLPNQKNRTIYEPYYQIYRGLYEQTKDLMAVLSEIRRKEI